jgi:hypothetical protein
MRRREVITLIGGAASGFLRARCQRPRIAHPKLPVRPSEADQKVGTSRYVAGQSNNGLTGQDQRACRSLSIAVQVV